MPYAERIEEVDEQGRVLTLADHTADIDRMIDEHNESRACFADEVPPPDDDPDPGATTGANTDGGTDPDDPDEATTDFSRRCGCQTPSDPAPILLGLLGLLGLRRRRRR
jgi:MYXO-CTERM domain-containing protein